jgi:hypothetical protein
MPTALMPSSFCLSRHAPSRWVTSLSPDGQLNAAPFSFQRTWQMILGTGRGSASADAFVCGQHIRAVAAFSIAPKCTDAVYSRFRSYSVSMSFPAPLSLHNYFVVAARMQHHFESNLVAVEESGVAALQDPDLAAFELFSGPRGNFMYYWYASLAVVVQGFRNLKLVDPRIDALLASPNVKALRRCWNGVFHFQPDYFSARLLEPMQTPDFIRWVRELMEAFRAYFAREIKPIES